jgi:hypothetical protein
MNEEMMLKENTAVEELRAKALLVFDLISRTLYQSLFSPSQEKDG